MLLVEGDHGSRLEHTKPAHVWLVNLWRPRHGLKPVKHHHLILLSINISIDIIIFDIIMIFVIIITSSIKPSALTSSPRASPLFKHQHLFHSAQNHQHHLQVSRHAGWCLQLRACCLHEGLFHTISRIPHSIFGIFSCPGSSSRYYLPLRSHCLTATLDL